MVYFSHLFIVGKKNVFDIYYGFNLKMSLKDSWVKAPEPLKGN